MTVVSYLSDMTGPILVKVVRGEPVTPDEMKTLISSILNLATDRLTLDNHEMSRINSYNYSRWLRKHGFSVSEIDVLLHYRLYRDYYQKSREYYDTSSYGRREHQMSRRESVRRQRQSQRQSQRQDEIDVDVGHVFESPSPSRCQCRTQRGLQCRNTATAGGRYCAVHRTCKTVVSSSE
jgi:hypothetical protein